MNTVDKLRILAGLWLQTRQPKIFSFHDCLPEVFSGYIDLLVSKRYRILGGEDLLQRLASEKMRAASGSTAKEAILTFDDGRRNCWTVIYPLLKKYKARAIFFVIPGRIKDTDEYYPNLEDYWAGRVSWENLYMSHRRQPYLTWRELETIQKSGLVDICSHGMKHEVVRVTSRVIDFQHPGVYEMPVYFDEWIAAGQPLLDYQWGAPVYERSWAPFASNVYVPDRRADTIMNEFVKKNGGFLFFKKKNWRKKLFDHYAAQKKMFGAGHFKKIANPEEARYALVASKSMIEERLKSACNFFSLPLYQGSDAILKNAREAGYKAVFTGPEKRPWAPVSGPARKEVPFLLNRIPSFWIKFLSYL